MLKPNQTKQKYLPKEEEEGEKRSVIQNFKEQEKEQLLFGVFFWLFEELDF